MLAVGTAPSKCVAILARFTSAHQGLRKPPRIAFESVSPHFRWQALWRLRGPKQSNRHEESNDPIGRMLKPFQDNLTTGDSIFPPQSRRWGQNPCQWNIWTAQRPMMNPQGRQSSKRGRGRVPCIGRSIVKKYHETLKPNKGNKKLYKERATLKRHRAKQAQKWSSSP